MAFGRDAGMLGGMKADRDLDPEQTNSGSEAHLRSILATIPDAMVVINDRGRILSFSAAAEMMFGYSESEIRGKNVSTLMPSPDRERHDGYLAHYMRTGERKIIGIGRLTTARRRNGNTFPIELEIGETRMGDERIFTGFIRDLTERQESELRLQDLQSELAHVGRVSEMGTLASSLAHELNQPLTAVANYCESARDLMEGGVDDETIALVREALDEATKQTLRAGEIVRRLRDYISHGALELRPESVARLVREANALALVGSRENGIEVQVDLDAESDTVFVDRIQIQQVLVNLIRNAIDATIDSPVRSIVISTVGEPKGFVTFGIDDTGSGISEEVAAQLFQPFITTKEKGMGIGLSICRTIVEAHGGRIWFESARPSGTSFRFTVPAVDEEE